jgi:hypothetical protein
MLWKWVSSGFGPLYDVRLVIFFSLWFLLGIQVIFSSFFISMLGISRRTCIGDYESQRIDYTAFDRFVGWDIS